MRQARMLTLSVLIAFAASVGAADTYTVTSTGDTGPGTLRQAITDANGHPGADTIAFNIAGSGVHTIAPATPLPGITDAVTVDGYTQAGSLANTNPTGMGLNTVLHIEIDGTNAGSQPCLHARHDDITIRGLVINRCSSYAIQGEDLGISHQNLVVEGCFLGTSADGSQALGPYFAGVGIDGFSNVRIGGTTPADRNLISGISGSAGIVLANATGSHVEGNLVGTDAAGLHKIATSTGGITINQGTSNVIGGTSAAARNVITDQIALGGSGLNSATGNFVQGNFIGTDVTGTRVLHCHAECVRVYDTGNTIGGSAPGAGNTIGGSNSIAGIQVQGSGTVIQGNFIGTDETGTHRLPNKDHGIRVVYRNTGDVQDILIGGTGPGEGNVIAYNGPISGIFVEGNSCCNPPKGVTIRGNSIYDNSGNSATNGLGIDLMEGGNGPGVNFNDAGDGDTGPNGFQNYPIIGSVTYGASTTTVTGTLNSMPSTSFDLDFYGSPICSSRPQDLAEGKTYLGTFPVTTNGSGDATFNAVLPMAVANGSPITATATDDAGNTSEFSPRFVISLSPTSGTPNGGAATITGLAFEDGATVTIGGVAAPFVSLVDAHTLSISVPQLPPGTINDVFVQNPGGGLSGTLPKGRISDFNDVSSGNDFYTYVTKLVASGITAGVGNGNYGVNQPTLREQMAVFLLKAKYGLCFTPPPCQGVFTDVPCPATPQFPYSDWIEELATEQITAGCDVGKYCPDAPVQRDQMAVFLLKMEHGFDYVPPDCTGVFADVACPGDFAVNWIEQLYTEGVTGGCLINPLRYCPTNANSRGEMSVFLVRTYGIP
jgi:hypothetical protein